MCYKVECVEFIHISLHVLTLSNHGIKLLKRYVVCVFATVCHRVDQVYVHALDWGPLKSQVSPTQSNTTRFSIVWKPLTF